MSFDNTYNVLMASVLMENVNTRVALLPGGFKPPHKGHFEALKHIIDTHACSKAVVFIGNKDRDGITASQAEMIWNIYGDNIADVDVDVRISEVTPVKSVYEYADEHRNDDLFIGAGVLDMRRYDWFKKHEDEYPNVSLVEIPDQFGRISGTEVREKIHNKSDDVLEFIPKLHDHDDVEV